MSRPIMEHYIIGAFILIFSSRSADSDSCITTQTDTGAVIFETLNTILQQNQSSLLEAVLEAECELFEDTRYKDYNASDSEEFDFIVVGSGSAGSAVAGRLSEEDWEVFVLEGGGDPTITSEVPSLAALNMGGDIDWQYRTQPQPGLNCLGSIDGRCNWPRGKCMGGCSSINFMWYLRGNPRDYDNWEKMGNPEWGWKDMLYYFKKAEGMKSKDVLAQNDALEYHSTEGPLGVDSFANNRQDLFNLCSEGMEELGVDTYVDANAQHTEGFYWLQGTMKDGRRCSSAFAYLHPHQSRTNLKISKNSLVTKVLIAADTKKAYGVTFMKNGKSYTVYARKEVILSAGSVRTPQILMLSGVGPTEHLESLDINVIQDLPVGENLHDHAINWGVPMTFNDTPPTSDAMSDAVEFLLDRKGPFVDLGSSDFSAFVHTQNRRYSTVDEQITSTAPSKSQSIYPDTQYLFLYIAKNSSATGPTFGGLGFNEDVQEQMVNINSDSAMMMLNSILLRPKSRGMVLLNTTNAEDYPLIYPNYFKDERDVQSFLDSMKFLVNLVETEPFKAAGAELQHLKISGCIKYPFLSTSYFRCIVKYMTSSYYHHVGSCKMGPRDNPSSVVDSSLRVIGIDSLRVCDASIMPKAPSSNTNAPTIAIAEKCADLIKATWKS